MYRGSNPTALKSSEMVTDALFRLMAETAYSEITVKEICYESKVSRQTVYNLFTSKDDIIHAYLHECVERVFDRTLKTDELSLELMLTVSMKVLKQNEERMRLIIDSGLEEFIRTEIYDGIAAIADIFFKGKSSETEDYKIAFLSGGFSSAILTWFKKGNTSDISILKDFLRMSFPPDIYQYFDN